MLFLKCGNQNYNFWEISKYSAAWGLICPSISLLFPAPIFGIYVRVRLKLDSRWKERWLCIQGVQIRNLLVKDKWILTTPSQLLLVYVRQFHECNYSQRHIYICMYSILLNKNVLIWFDMKFKKIKKIFQSYDLKSKLCQINQNNI